MLRTWGRKRSVQVDFVLGPDRRLGEGLAVEVALGALHVRPFRTLHLAGAFGLALLLLLHGPPLSLSTTNSWAVAPRLRRRLWPQLPAGELIEFGRPLPIS